MPTYWPVELNAHTILYLILLVQQQQYSIEMLNIYLFNSQSCESTFRNARALSSIFSSRINFTIEDFLQRAEKLKILYLIKCEEQSSKKPNHLVFPVHHKNKAGDFSPSQNMININALNIEEIIFKAYKQAQEFIKTLNMSALLQKKKAFMLKDLSTKVMEHFKTRCQTSDNATIDADSDLNDTDNTNEEDDDEDEESENENDLCSADDDEDVEFLEDNDADDSYSEDNDEDDDYLDNNEDKKETVITKKIIFNGTRVYNNVNTKLKDSYFEVLINGKVKFIHKRTACWILTKEENKLSADRLTRVTQMNKKD
jgi:cobalamin biosynthesis protein CobT